jgi:predicted CopG family antitoxin
MKAIRISDNAYSFLSKIAKEEKRSLIATLDLFVQIFKEGQDVKLEKESLPFTNQAKIKNKQSTLVNAKKKSI